MGYGTYRIVTVVLAVLITGSLSCSRITLLRTQELRAVQDHVDSLKLELVATMEREQKLQSELLRLIRADQQVRFAELERRISSLDNNLSENQYKLTQIDEKTQAIKKTWDEKLRNDSTAASNKTAETDKLFQLAAGDFNAGRYDLALNGFADLVRRAPGMPQAEDPAFWVAECYYVLKNGERADSAYLAYIKNYPMGKKNCIALFKLGLVYENTGKPKSRDMVWKKLLDNCPNSEEAKTVAARRNER